MIQLETIKNRVVQILQEYQERDVILLMVSQLLKEEIFHYDWVGFYLFDNDKSGLILGPYCGAKTDHTFIPLGKGVCGQVAQSKQLMVVQDVNAIDNYLSCSLNVQSEIVFPILRNGEFVAELDIDSHSPAPFTSEDNLLLGFICEKLSVLFE